MSSFGFVEEIGSLLYMFILKDKQEFITEFVHDSTSRTKRSSVYSLLNLKVF